MKSGKTGNVGRGMVNEEIGRKRFEVGGKIGPKENDIKDDITRATIVFKSRFSATHFGLKKLLIKIVILQ